MTTPPTDINDCPLGQAIWRKFTVGGLGTVWIAYLYVTKAGYPVGVTAGSLERARQRRDTHLELMCDRVPKPGEVVETEIGDIETTQASAVPASECCDARCNRDTQPRMAKPQPDVLRRLGAPND